MRLRARRPFPPDRPSRPSLLLLDVVLVHDPFAALTFHAILRDVVLPGRHKPDNLINSAGVVGIPALGPNELAHFVDVHVSSACSGWLSATSNDTHSRPWRCTA